MTKSSRSPETLAWISLLLSLVFFVVTFLVGRWSGYAVLSSISWLVLSSAFVWLVLALQFRQRLMAEREKLDMNALSQAEQASTIFQSGEGRAALFAVAQRRLAAFEKWFLPGFSLLIAGYQATLGVILLVGMDREVDSEGNKTLIAAVVVTGVAFVSFLMSRYATGMSSQEQWRPLRAGGSSYLTVAILCFVLAVSIGAAFLRYPLLLAVASWLAPCLLVILGAETAVNVVLDIYRPRVRGQYNRAAFDSRILGIINEPGGIFHSAAAAIDYQFGFQVSQTWFYKLLEKAIVPLTLFGILTLYLLSCIVVIAPDEEAIVEHWGNPLNKAQEARHWGPGLHVKWPWPIDRVYRHSTQQIDELLIGFKRKEAEAGQWQMPEPLLWGKGHFEEEYSVLVASEQTGTQQDDGVPPVGLLKASIPVHFRVKDLYGYLYRYAEPQRLLEEICYRELGQLAASSLVEISDSSSDRVSLLGDGRVQAGRLLRKRIQAASDAAGLGIEIVFLGVQGIHPPADAEVAKKYQEVVGAIQDRQTLILMAQAMSNGVLSQLAGSVQEAKDLYQLSQNYQQLSSESPDGTAQSVARQLDKALTQAKGNIFATLRTAQAYAYAKPTFARAAGLRFAGQVEAYRSAPDIYTHSLLLAALEESLAGIRKYVFLTDPEDHEVMILNLEEKLMNDLLDIGNLEETVAP